MDTSDTDAASRRDSEQSTIDQINAVMLAARAIVAITAQSVADLDDQVTLAQLRVLVMIASRGPQNLAAIAAGLRVHPSNATRVCDRLVVAGLLHRRDDPDDRRNLILRLTPEGRTLVDTMNQNRRAAIEGVLSRMPPSHRRGLAPKLRAFAEAAGELPDTGAWALGWTTEQPVQTAGTGGSAT
jgi:DNA-binding MarR family transcriptional regulator